MAGGRAAARVALKGIAKPLEKLLKECEEILAKDIAKAGRKGATSFETDATESLAQRLTRQEARGLSENAAGTTTKDWSKKATELYGRPPEGMFQNAHGHHIVFKGATGEAAEFSSRSQEILRHFGIDPINGNANIIWAENANHSVANAKEVLSRLTEAATSGGGRQAVVDALQKAGRQVFNGWP